MAFLLYSYTKIYYRQEVVRDVVAQVLGGGGINGDLRVSCLMEVYEITCYVLLLELGIQDI